MIKVKAGTVFSAYEVLKAAIRQNRDDRVRLPTRAAVFFALLTRKLEPDYLALAEVRVELMKSLGLESKEQPGYWSVKPENQERFNAEWKTATEEIVEVQIRPMPIETLGDGASYFSLGELTILQDFLKEEA